MIDVKATVSEILNAYEGPDFPDDFLDKYVQLECLSWGHGTETFLVRHRSSGQLCVAKCFDQKHYAAVQEGNILKTLEHSGLPAFADEFRNDSMTCIVREYMRGEPLDVYVKDKPPDERAVKDICIQLCDILTYLHDRKEPVIHRDIKPQNIIVGSCGRISLIDFDISRTYHAGAGNDTLHFGTREYAPPEQYGYSQTDCRTDIYSLGVVLGWLLTGETAAEKAVPKIRNRRLARIYRKCTAFSPEDRFSSARKLKSALLASDGSQAAAIGRRTAVIIACMALFCAGFFTGRHTDFLKPVPAEPAGTVFAEPLIEKAVRLQLGKGADEAVTGDDLLSVTELYIFGDSLTAKSEKELHSTAQQLFAEGRMKEGSVRSLEDLEKMPYLKQVIISMQKITDISPLAELHNLEYVDLKNNPVSDISPLGELKFLKNVSLYDTHVTDLSPLARCPMLCELDAGKLPVSSLTAFSGFSNLKNLRLNDTTMASLTGAEALAQLEQLEVSGIADGDLTPLLSLPQLKRVVLGEAMKLSGDAIAPEASFIIEYR